MKTAANYLDDIRKHCGLPSDYAAAKALGLTRAAVSKYRNGLGQFDDTTAVKVASLLGIDPLEVLAASAYGRSKDEAARAAWGAIWGKATGAIAPGLKACVVGALAVVPRVTRAKSDTDKTKLGGRVFNLFPHCNVDLGTELSPLSAAA